MLSNSNNNYLISKYQINEHIIYFYQVWQEMVDSRTLDVYQYKMLNSYVAIDELIDVINKTICGLYTTSYNFENCRQETLSILKEDDILDKHERPLLCKLLSSLGSIKMSSSDADKRSLKYQLQYVEKKLSVTYLKLLLDELYEDISTDNYDNIDKHTKFLISQCIYNKWSPKALFDELRIFKTFSENTLKEQWEKFNRNICNIDNSKFDVLISFSIKTGQQYQNNQVIKTLNSLDITMNTYDELVSIYNNIDNIETHLSKNKKYTVERIVAPDVYTASRIAVKNITGKVNIASFYNIIDVWDLKSSTILCINVDSKYKKIIKSEELSRTYNYIDSSSMIFESTKKIFSDSNKATIMDKLKGTFAYANIGKISIFQEEKYMNLWVALESLTRTDMYSDIFSNIKEILPASSCQRYIYRIIRNFAEDCIRCGIDLKFDTVEVDINQETKQKLVSQLIEIFKDDILYGKLYNKCDCNKLLYRRCLSIHNLITNVCYARKKIENHHTMLKWQLQRLYRIRNEIAHSALQNDVSLITYIEQLHDYLSNFITEIVTCLEKKKLNSLEEVYCILKDNYEVFLELTKDGRNNEFIDTVINTGIIDLVMRDY